MVSILQSIVKTNIIQTVKANLDKQSTHTTIYIYLFDSELNYMDDRSKYLH
jgi:hypothetical protein